MKLFIVGGTGRTGRWVVRSAMNHGHELSCLVRKGSKPGIVEKNVIDNRVAWTLGDVTVPASLPDSYFDAVISTLDSGTVEEGTQNLIDWMKQTGTPRFIGLAGGGILQLNASQLRRDRPGYPKVFLSSSEGHLHAWKMLEASLLEWTLVCTPDLLDQPATGNVVSELDTLPEAQNSVAAGDVAEFMMTELNARACLRRRVGLAARR